LALVDSGMDLDAVNHERFGVMVGSGIGGLRSMEEECRRLFDRGPSRVSPFTIAMMISNMASGLVSMEFDLRGPNMSIVTACATSNHSIGEAWRMIKFDDADCFVAGGSEATITHLGMSGFSAMRALSLRNDEPSLRVTSVHPGRIATAMQKVLVAYEGGDYDPSRYLQPETVAKVVADAVNAPPDAHIHEVIVRPR